VISLVDGVSGTASVQTAETGIRTFAMHPRGNAAGDGLIGMMDLKGRVSVSSLHVDNHPMGKTYSSNDVVYSLQELVHPAVAMMTDADVEAGCKISWAPGSCSYTSHGVAPSVSVEVKNVLAVPGKRGSCVLVLEKPDYWSDVNLVPEDAEGDLSHGENDLNLAVFNPQGTHLATADVLGGVLVWEMNASNIQQSKPVKKFAGVGAALYDLAWGRCDGDNYLLASTRKGWGRLDDAAVAAPASVEATPSPPAAAESSSQTPSVAPAAAAKKKLVKKNAALDDSDDEADFAAPAAAAAAAAAPASASASGSVAAMPADSAVDIDMTSVAAIKNAAQRKLRKTSDEDDDEDGEMEEDGDIKNEWDRNAMGQGLSDMDTRLALLETAKSDSMVRIQEPFQPGSTTNDDKYRRYLVWNSIGSITLREEHEQGQNRIEIRFADVNGRNKQEAFADTDGYIMAALSHEGAIFATAMGDADDDDIRKPLGSKIHYHAFPAQQKLVGANETFTASLPEGEEATNVAVGSGWCAVATTAGFLRVFSSTGVQTNVYWLKGPTVTLCGTSTQLAVFYNAGQPVAGTVQIKLELYSLFWDRPSANRCISSDLSVPLSQGASLRWAGFETDTRCVCICDSVGMVSMLFKPMGWQWVPVLDIERAKRDPSHVWWPIQIRKDKLGYVLLNGESKPAIYPPPVVATRPLRIPIAEVREGKDKGEAANQRSHDLVFAQAVTAHYEACKVEEDVFGLWSIEDDMTPEALETRYEKQQIEADKTVLKMFQDACRTHQLAKALDLAHKLRTEKALQAGTQIANKFGRPTVAAKVDDLREVRFAQQQQARQQQQQEQEHMYFREEPAAAVPARAAAQHAPSYTVEHEQSGYASDSGAQPVEIYHDAAYESLALGPAGSVTPAEERSKPANPFKKAQHSPVKRKAGEYAMDDLKRMKASPSPAKKPLLSRQSSFTENARLGTQRMSSNSFL